MPILLDPPAFTVVKYDPAEITGIAARIAALVGFAPDTSITVRVDERTVLARVRVAGVDPIVIDVEGGAFEDPKHPRMLSVERTELALGRAFFLVADRRSGRFDGAPADAKLTLAEAMVWDTYGAGRCRQIGVDVPRQRHLYAFRNRLGFTDRADATFERLWNASGLSWDDLVQAIADCAEPR